MSDSDSYTTSGGGGENEGACGKLLEEIADQEQVIELDPIDVMLDKMLSFCDLDKSLVSEEDREGLYKRLEQIGLEQETVLVMFENKNNMLVEVPLESDSDQPKAFLAKPAGHAIKVLMITRRRIILTQRSLCSSSYRWRMQLPMRVFYREVLSR